MYKVFIDNIPILFQKTQNFKTNLSIGKPHANDESYIEFKKEIFKESVSTPLFINGMNPLKELKNFFENFKWIEAAGGIVRNKKTNKFLFIYRNDCWDLPKGKIEKGETPPIAAIREIQEECGLSSMEIIEELKPTFHVYRAYGDFWIKKTYWFKLETNEENVLPQKEEDIIEVIWFPREKIEEVKMNTYLSLIDIINSI